MELEKVLSHIYHQRIAGFASCMMDLLQNSVPKEMTGHLRPSVASIDNRVDRIDHHMSDVEWESLDSLEKHDHDWENCTLDFHSQGRNVDVDDVLASGEIDFEVTLSNHNYLVYLEVVADLAARFHVDFCELEVEEVVHQDWVAIRNHLDEVIHTVTDGQHR